jgi:hypothetical protein
LFASAPALAEESAAPAPVPPPPGVVEVEPVVPAPAAPAAAAPVAAAPEALAAASAESPTVEPEESLSAPAPRLAPARVASVPAEVAPLSEPAKTEHVKLQFVPGPTKDAPLEQPKKGGENGLLGPVRLGPMLGAGFPGFMTVGANARVAKLIGLGVNYGYSPEVSVSSMSVSAWNMEGYARLYPFKSPFFIGAGVGTQKLSGKASQSGGTAAGSVTTTYVAPTLGFMWTWDFGLALGFDVGVQIPVSNTRQYDATFAGIAVPDSELKDLDDTLKKIGTTPIPVVNALRVGFLF